LRLAVNSHRGKFLKSKQMEGMKSEK